MFNQTLLDTVAKLFPNTKIAYKDQSTFMKILGTLMFFNPQFMTTYTTTIGNTIYFPSTNYVNTHPVSAFIVLNHELTHVHDQNKFGRLWFQLGYLLPQLLFLPSLLLFLLSWKIALPVSLFFLLPLPAYFRALFEKRAYMAAIYVMNKLNAKSNYNINLVAQRDFFVQQFKNSAYYFMWPFPNIDKDFNDALQKITQGQRPFDDTVFDLLDQLIASF